MPASNEEFIKKAFQSGLNSDQVRAAVAERNQRNSTPSSSQNTPNDTGIAGSNGPLATVAKFVLPRTLDYAKNELFKIGAGTAEKGQSLQEIGASALGPLGPILLGSQRQKEQMGSAGELASYAIPGVAGAGAIAPEWVKAAAQGMTGAALNRVTNPDDSNILEKAKGTYDAANAGGTTAAVADLGMNLVKNILGFSGGKAEKIGSDMRASVGKITRPASVYGPQEEKAIESTLNRRGITGNAQHKYEQLQPVMSKIENEIQDKVGSTDLKVPVSRIKTSFKDKLKSSLLSKDMTSAQATSEVNGFLTDLNKMSGGTGKFTELNAEKVLQWKRLINESYKTIAKKLETGGALTPRERVISVAWKSIDGAVSETFPEIKSLLTEQSHLYQAAPSLASARKTVPTFRFMGTTIPSSVSQWITDLAGRGAEGSGGIVNGAGNKIPTSVNSELINLLSVMAAKKNDSHNNQNTNQFPEVLLGNQRPSNSQDSITNINDNGNGKGSNNNSSGNFPHSQIIPQNDPLSPLRRILKKIQAEQVVSPLP